MYSMKKFLLGMSLLMGLSVFGQSSDATLQVFAAPVQSDGKKIENKEDTKNPSHQEITLAVRIPKGKSVSSFNITLGKKEKSKGKVGTWTIPFDLSNTDITQKGDVIYINVGVYNVMAGIYATAEVNYSDETSSGELVYNSNK